MTLEFEGEPAQEAVIKTVVNKTRKPIRLSLPRGKTLYLGPSASGQVHDEVPERPQFKKLIKDGEIEVVDQGQASVTAGKTSNQVRESTPGHAPKRIVTRKGDR